ncbi:MAG TPA: YihY/virulence factor BrkB family protein [Bryobacteraceae bacterium]|nr:YihY/virulence factor BrkB family protein [Bryobacteraceae bacterium]
MHSGEHYKPVLEAQGSELKTPAGGARWYRKPLKRIRWRDIKSLLGESFDQWNKHNATRLGASLAFYALLSLAPLLLVLISIVGLVFGHSMARRTTVEQVRALVGPTAGDALAAFIAGSRNTTHGVIATAFGIATLLFSASGVVTELRSALNTIWDVPESDTSGIQMVKGFIKRRLFSFAIVMGVGFLLIVSLAVSTWINALGKFVPSFPGLETALLDTGSSIFSFLVIAGLFAAIYKVMPDIHIEWRDVLLGGAVTSLLFTIGKQLLSLYLGRASYTSTYGAAASVVVLIAWVYYSAQIFFLGAEFTRTFACRYGSHRDKSPRKMVRLASDATGPSDAEIVTPAASERVEKASSTAKGAAGSG